MKFSISKYTEGSVVYKGLRTALGARTVTYFLRKMFKDGYVLKICLCMWSGCHETPDIVKANFSFIKEDEEYLVTVFWHTVGRENLLKEIYSIKSVEITKNETIQID